MTWTAGERESEREIWKFNSSRVRTYRDTNLVEPGLAPIYGYVLGLESHFWGTQDLTTFLHNFRNIISVALYCGNSCPFTPANSSCGMLHNIAPKCNDPEPPEEEPYLSEEGVEPLAPRRRDRARQQERS